MQRLTLIDKAFLLKRTPLFQTLNLDLLLAIAQQLGSIHFDPGEYVFHAGEEGSRLYFVLDGEVSLHTPSGERAVLSVGDFFGEEAVLNATLRAYTAQATTHASLLTLSRIAFYAIISEYPDVALGLLRIYTARMPCRYLEQRVPS